MINMHLACPSCGQITLVKSLGHMPDSVDIYRFELVIHTPTVVSQYFERISFTPSAHFINTVKARHREDSPMKEMYRKVAMLLPVALILAACVTPPAAAPAAPAEAAPAAEATATPAAVAAAPEAPAAQSGGRLQIVIDRGNLICGVNDQLPGFGTLEADGSYVGFDVDFCKAVAAAVFGDG